MQYLGGTLTEVNSASGSALSLEALEEAEGSCGSRGLSVHVGIGAKDPGGPREQQGARTQGPGAGG